MIGSLWSGWNIFRKFCQVRQFSFTILPPFVVVVQFKSMGERTGFSESRYLRKRGATVPVPPKPTQPRCLQVRSGVAGISSGSFAWFGNFPLQYFSHSELLF